MRSRFNQGTLDDIHRITLRPAYWHRWLHPHSVYRDCWLLAGSAACAWPSPRGRRRRASRAPSWPSSVGLQEVVESSAAWNWGSISIRNCKCFVAQAWPCIRHQPGSWRPGRHRGPVRERRADPGVVGIRPHLGAEGRRALPAHPQRDRRAVRAHAVLRRRAQECGTGAPAWGVGVCNLHVLGEADATICPRARLTQCTPCICLHAEPHEHALSVECENILCTFGICKRHAHNR